MIDVRATGLVYRNPRPSHQSLHAWHPSLVRLADGSWLCGFDLATVDLALDYRTVLARSTDDGRTWSDPVDLFPPSSLDREGRPTTNSLRLSRVRDGLLATGARWFRDGRYADGLNTETLGWCPMDLLIARSGDEGATWSAPAVIRPPVLAPAWEICHAALELADGRLILPTSTWRGFDGEAPEGMRALALVSGDGGGTWPGVLEEFDRYAESVVHWEQSVVQLPDGRLVAVAWALDIETNRTESTPFAVTGPDGRAFGPRGETGFRAQTCKLLALPDGRVLAVYRNDDRPGLWATLARLEGDTWTNLETAPLWQGAASGFDGGRSPGEELIALAFGFPTPVLRPDGDVMVVFWSREECVHNIRWLQVAIGT